MKEEIARLEEWVYHPDNEFSTDKIKMCFQELALAIVKFDKKYN